MDTLEEKSIITTRGLKYRYYISQPSDGNPAKQALMLQHGFPATASSWVPLLASLRQLPNRIILPDMLGFGGTAKPTEPAAYAYNLMTQDLLDILDAEEVDKVISVGHDHGSGSAQRFYNHAPHRTAALILLNVAYIPPNKSSAFDIAAVNASAKKIFGYPFFEYWNFLTAPEAAQLMASNVDRVWEAAHAGSFEEKKSLYGVPGGYRRYLADHSVPAINIKPYARDAQLKADWITAFKEGGFEGPLCWYVSRLQQVQFESDKLVADENIRVNVPLQFIGCTEDAVCRRELITLPRDAGLLPDLTVDTMEGIGHWPMYESPDETARLIVKFIREKSL